MDKYYTPSIEDLHVGYECEVMWYGSWTPTVLSQALCHLAEMLDSDGLRTPYLTKEQIEAEGWTEAGEKYYTKGVYEIKHISTTVKIYKTLRHSFDCNTEPDIYEHVFYWGECPSINEFRKICKLLGI